MVSDGIRTRGLRGAGGLAAGYLALTGLLIWGSAGAISGVRTAGPAAVDAELSLAAAIGAWLVLSWLTAVTVGALLTAAVAGLGSTTHQRALALAPAAARRLVASLLGLTVIALPVATGLPAGAAQRPAAAVVGASDRRADPAAPPSLDRPAAGRSAVSPPADWTPDRPAAPRRRSGTGEAALRLVTTAPRIGRVVAEEVVVRRGDSLWDIAAGHLGSTASDADIALEWPRWYAANRAVIGADPDLLLPGQRLVPPT